MPIWGPDRTMATNDGGAAAGSAKRAGREEFTAQLESLARSKPVLMIFEDIHWIDPTSLEALCNDHAVRLCNALQARGLSIPPNLRTSPSLGGARRGLLDVRLGRAD
jgi:hypothetical protein